MSKEYSPTYYSRFSCKAGACQDTCCACWELPVDDETYDYYASLNNAFGTQLINAVCSDDDGDRCFALIDGKCPFLNEDKLCRIHQTLGEAHTPAVCRQHPSFIEEFDGFTELSLSLSCPAANELIFSSPIKSRLYPTPKETVEDDYLSMLITARSELFSELCAENNALAGLLCVLQKGQSVQKSFDEEDETFLPLNTARLFTAGFMTAFAKDLLSDSEILKDEWKDLLQKTATASFEQNDMESFMKKNANHVRIALSYFVYRYFLKAINDCDPELESAFIVFCVLFCACISDKTQVPYQEVCRLFSKEIEHNLNNVEYIKETLFARLA